MKKNISVLLWFIFSNCCLINAQPFYIYQGGEGDGDAMSIFETNNTLNFTGGCGGGFVNSILTNSNVFSYLGGADAGDNSQLLESVNSNLYFAGSGMGNDLVYFSGINDGLYVGGMGQGHILNTITTSNMQLYFGGEDDGYVSYLERVPFIWTGAQNWRWNVLNNWKHGVLPTLDRAVIIPSTANNWPIITANKFAVGSNPNGATRFCKSLTVESGAEFITSSNNKMENFGEIYIDGILSIRSSRVNPFESFSGSILTVGNMGLLEVK